MQRRDFITLLGGAAAAWPLAAWAQQPVVGFLGAASARGYAAQVAAFRKGLQEAGYVEGRNVAIEYGWAEGRFERLPELVADLVRRQVRVIVANGDITAATAKAATASIPVVFSIAGDPVASGFVACLARPGGNLTGATSLGIEVGAKRLELLHELVPSATTIALLVNPTNRANLDTLLRDHQTAARARGVQLHVLQASSEREIDAAFATLVQLTTEPLVIGPDAFFNDRIEQLAELTVRHAMPTIYYRREFVEAGGLMVYGPNSMDQYRVAGVYTGRILKGEKPADLPVQQATRVELIINMKTAKALGLTFPLTLLGRADEVIE